jgi:hypothetical protein
LSPDPFSSYSFDQSIFDVIAGWENSAQQDLQRAINYEPQVVSVDIIGGHMGDDMREYYGADTWSGWYFGLVGDGIDTFLPSTPGRILHYDNGSQLYVPGGPTSGTLAEIGGALLGPKLIRFPSTAITKIDDIARQATLRPNSPWVLLGKYSDDASNYLKVAEDLAATAFDLKNWKGFFTG